jgi:hypothetical protein
MRDFFGLTREPAVRRLGFVIQLIL